MTFLEPIIAVAVGVTAALFAARFNKSAASNTLKKYGPLVQKAYNIIDPILDQNMRNWSGSQVDATFEVVVETLADGQLTSAEIKRIATELAAAWLPAVAATKVRNMRKLAIFFLKLKQLTLLLITLMVLLINLLFLRQSANTLTTNHV
jgi:hypothetical protein